MKVAKFGGSSLASADLVGRVCDIITADPDRRLIVVSAPGRRHPGDTRGAARGSGCGTIIDSS